MCCGEGCGAAIIDKFGYSKVSAYRMSWMLMDAHKEAWKTVNNLLNI